MVEQQDNPGPGTCGFCGTGDGWLGEQGDESTQSLEGVVRTGDTPDDWDYELHPNSWGHEGEMSFQKQVTWCGHCIGGLKHKFQRYDDTNLNAKYVSYKLRLEMDGLRWAVWEDPDGPIRQYRDDTAIHIEKLQIERELHDLENERFRRAGYDLTKDGWRP